MPEVVYHFVTPTCYYCGKEADLTDELEVHLPDGRVRYVCDSVCESALVAQYQPA